MTGSKLFSSDRLHRGARYYAVFGILLAIAGTFACSRTEPDRSSSVPATGKVAPNQAAVPADEDGQWPMPGKNYQNTRYSGLDQINTTNAAALKVAWTFSTGVNRGQEAAPIVVGDTMYVVTPFPNVLYALDLKNNGTLKWRYEPKPEQASQGHRSAPTADGSMSPRRRAIR